MELPVFGGNWIDLIILLFLLISLAVGWQRGFLGGVLDLFGFLLAFLLALKFYPLNTKFLMANFSLTLGIAKALGFFLIAILTESFLAVIFNFWHSRIPFKIINSNPNRFLGLLPSLGQTLVFVTFVLVLTLALPVRGNIKKDIYDSRIGKVLVSQTQGMEQRMAQVFGGAIEETLNFFTIRPESKETIDLRFTQKELTVDGASEKIMFELVNREREREGLRVLVWEEKLAIAARFHAQDMFENGYFSHYDSEGLSPSTRLLRVGASFTVTGENLALVPSVELAHKGLMESPGHRANILGEEFRRLGIGVIDGGVYGKMFVQEFTD